MELFDGNDEEFILDYVKLEDRGKYNCIVLNRLNVEKSNIVEL